MKTLITTLAMFIAGSLFGYSQNSIELNISNLKNNEGKVIAGLYDSQGKWLDTAFKTAKANIDNKGARIIFENIPAGTYAVSAFHDEDNDGELDMVMGFYPSEDYTCSNNAKGRFGPPKWEDAKFTITASENILQNVKMN